MIAEIFLSKNNMSFQIIVQVQLRDPVYVGMEPWEGVLDADALLPRAVQRFGKVFIQLVNLANLVCPFKALLDESCAAFATYDVGWQRFRCSLRFVLKASNNGWTMLIRWQDGEVDPQRNVLSVQRVVAMPVKSGRNLVGKSTGSLGLWAHNWGVDLAVFVVDLGHRCSVTIAIGVFMPMVASSIHGGCN